MMSFCLCTLHLYLYFIFISVFHSVVLYIVFIAGVVFFEEFTILFAVGGQLDEQIAFLTTYPHVVGAQLYRMSPVDAHTVALKPIRGKITRHSLHDVVLRHFAACTSVNLSMSWA